MRAIQPGSESPETGTAKPSWRSRGLKRTKAREIVHGLLQDAH